MAQQLTTINGNMGSRQHSKMGIEESYGWRMRNDPSTYGDSISFELPGNPTRFNGEGTYLLRLELYNSRGALVRTHQVAIVFCGPADYKVLFVPLLEPEDPDGNEYLYDRLLDQIEELLERFPFYSYLNTTMGLNWDISMPGIPLLETWLNGYCVRLPENFILYEILAAIVDIRTSYNADANQNDGIPAIAVQGVITRSLHSNDLHCWYPGKGSGTTAVAAMYHDTMVHELYHQTGNYDEDFGIADTCEGDLNHSGECDDWAWLHQLFPEEQAPIHGVVCETTRNAQSSNRNGGGLLVHQENLLQ